MIEYIKSLFFGKLTPTTYIVVDCPKMPSAVGMQFVGKLSTKTKLIIKNDKEFRTLIPQSIKSIEKGFIVETKHLTIIFHEKEG